MTGAWEWLLLAAGLLLLPPASRPAAARRAAVRPPARPAPPRRTDVRAGSAAPVAPVPHQPLSPRTLQFVAAVAAGTGVVVLAGSAAGAVLAVGASGVAWFSVGVLHARAPRRRRPIDLALALDLVAAALRSGQPLSSALLLAAPAADPETAAALARTGGLLRLGADPADAWGSAIGQAGLESVAAAAIRSADSGIRLSAAFDRLAADVRADAEAAAEARAHRAGVWAVAPLGLCFLPAFVCLGIVPVVVGIAGRALTSLQ